MSDQATKLREQLLKLNKPGNKVIGIVSGKGGVGKSNFSLNFAISLSQKKKKVLLLDLDIGMGNIDVLLGTVTNLSIIDIFGKNLTIRDIMNIGPYGLNYISGGSGLSTIFAMSEANLSHFLNELEDAMDEFDYIIFDMGAGVSEQTIKLLSAMHEVIVMTTPEPTAVMDAYAMIKHMVLNQVEAKLSIVINRISSQKEGESVHLRLEKAVAHFMNVEVNLLGMIFDDSIVRKAVISQKPFILQAPSSLPSRNIDLICNKYLNEENKGATSHSFIHRMKTLFLKR
ncbi:P-loop NTPase [Gottfriedia luciferensis]|uniref:P-loop NTPase n=1 Tax=Gottfriedia luciferensis TaxID=178774 RepID=UPI000B44E764|nr:P-loop NTPase [Gottfriedia luciferensis]